MDPEGVEPSSAAIFGFLDTLPAPRLATPGAGCRAVFPAHVRVPCLSSLPPR